MTVITLGLEGWLDAVSTSLLAISRTIQWVLVLLVELSFLLFVQLERRWETLLAATRTTKHRVPLLHWPTLLQPQGLVPSAQQR